MLAAKDCLADGALAPRRAAVTEGTQGFTYVLCAMKLLLERGQSMRIVADKAQLVRERV